MFIKTVLRSSQEEDITRGEEEFTLNLRRGSMQRILSIDVDLRKIRNHQIEGKSEFGRIISRPSDLSDYKRRIVEGLVNDQIKS
jgi:hypothetical protein